MTLAFIAAMPLWGPGIVNTRGGGDSPFLLWRVHQLVANLRAGDFPARWMPDAAYGLGYPFFNYYAALPYYIASLFSLLGLDILTAVKLTQTLGFVFAATTSYTWFRRAFKSRAAAWLGATAYTFAPFHLVNVYVRGDSLSEFYAFAFYPLVLWAVDNATEHRIVKSSTPIITLGLAFGGLVITHNISALNFLPFVALYAIFRISILRLPPRLHSGHGFHGTTGASEQAFDSQPLNSASTSTGRARQRRPADRRERQEPQGKPPTLRLRSGQASNIQYPISNLTTVAAGLALGLALSVWYWLPALLEIRYAQPATLGEGYFHYSGHFRSADLVQPSPGFVYDTTLDQISPFAMGLMQALAAGLGILSYCVSRIPYLESRSTQHPPPFNLQSSISNLQSPISNFYIATVGLALSTLMITPLSKPLWEHLPLLPLAQFPWRFLSIQALFAAMSTAFLAEYLPRWRSGVAIAVTTVLALAVMLPLHPDRLLIDAGDVSTQRLQLYELFTTNIGTSITYEYLPRDVNPRPYTSELLIDPSASPPAFAIEGELISAREVLHRPTQRTWQVEANTDATLVFPLLYWPGWKATIDGAPTPVRPAHSSGRITLDVPHGRHTVRLQLGRTLLRLAVEITSLLALLTCAVFCVLRITPSTPLRARHHVSRITYHVSRFTSSPNLVVIGYLLLALSLIIIADKSFPAPAAPGETMDFIQMPYLHSGAVYFETGSGEGYNALSGYQIGSEQVIAGQPIYLSLDWAIVDSPLTATVSLENISEHLPDLHAPIPLSRSSTRLNQQAQVTSQHTLYAPPDLPKGVYLVQVSLVGADGKRAAYTASGSKLGQVYLRPIYVRNEQPLKDEPVIATFGDRIHLHTVHAEQTRPAQLLVKFEWSVSKPVAENYGIAVRLYGTRGDRWASIDTQPGYGFLPTVTWRPREKIKDQLALPLPKGLQPRDDYELEIILYDLARDLAGIGQHFQPGIALTQYARRRLDSPVLAKVSPQLALATLELSATHPQGVPVLAFETGWLATAVPASDALAVWSLVDETGNAVATETIELEAAAWPVGAYVFDAIHMHVPIGLTPGHYSLAVALLEAPSGEQEPARVEIGAAPLEQKIEVTGRSRNFELPPLDHRLTVDLGEQVQLEGYTLARDNDTLHLTLAWRAQQVMSEDHTVFVHLMKAGEEAIAAQHDAMPVGNTYPTSWWAAGEIVTDTITLSIKDVVPGVYRLACGMYDSATQTRLEAYGPDGQRLPADRIILPEDIQLP